MLAPGLFVASPAGAPHRSLGGVGVELALVRVQDSGVQTDDATLGVVNGAHLRAGGSNGEGERVKRQLVGIKSARNEGRLSQVGKRFLCGKAVGLVG